MMNGNVFSDLQPNGSILTPEVHVFSHSVFCTGPGALWPHTVFLTCGNRRQHMS